MNEFGVRLATVADATRIARHRNRMFVESGQVDEARGFEVEAAFTPWVVPRLESGSYIGWLAYPEGQPEKIVAGAGLLLMEFAPHFLDLTPMRGYLLNFYVEPEYRGNKLAQRLLEVAVAETKRRGIGVVSLHASVMGKPIYERYGFKASNEMLFRNPET